MLTHVKIIFETVTVIIWPLVSRSSCHWKHYGYNFFYFFQQKFFFFIYYSRCLSRFSREKASPFVRGLRAKLTCTHGKSIDGIRLKTEFFRKTQNCDAYGLFVRIINYRDTYLRVISAAIISVRSITSKKTAPGSGVSKRLSRRVPHSGTFYT